MNSLGILINTPIHLYQLYTINSCYYDTVGLRRKYHYHYIQIIIMSSIYLVVDGRNSVVISSIWYIRISNNKRVWSSKNRHKRLIISNSWHVWKSHCNIIQSFFCFYKLLYNTVISCFYKLIYNTVISCFYKLLHNTVISCFYKLLYNTAGP